MKKILIATLCLLLVPFTAYALTCNDLTQGMSKWQGGQTFKLAIVAGTCALSKSGTDETLMAGIKSCSIINKVPTMICQSTNPNVTIKMQVQLLNSTTIKFQDFNQAPIYGPKTPINMTKQSS